jgi:hypothetical protein
MTEPLKIGEWTTDTEDRRVKIAACGCLTDAEGFLVWATCQPHIFAMSVRAQYQKGTIEQIQIPK